MSLRTPIVLAVLLSATPAVAAPDEAGRTKSTLRLMGNMGIGSAVGAMGGTFTYAPLPRAQFELGVGLGFSGVQLSIMPKLASANRQHNLVVGMGPSLAVGRNRSPTVTCVSLWLNGEVGYEYRSARGLSFLVAVGFTKGLAGTMPDDGAPGVREPGDSATPDTVAGLPPLPQGRIAFGHWF